MRENFVINPKYSHLAEKLKEVLHNFSKKGEYVTKGERNVIKNLKLRIPFSRWYMNLFVKARRSALLNTLQN